MKYRHSGNRQRVSDGWRTHRPELSLCVRWWRAREQGSVALQQAGFTLLEVLVAMVILGIGLLGLAALQQQALRYSHSAFERTQAALLAYDLADRMRANPVALAAGGYLQRQPQASAACDSADGCAADARAGHDLYEWQQRLQEQLPAAQWGLCRDSSADDGTPEQLSCSDSGDLYAIKLWWPDVRGDGLERLVLEVRSGR